MAKCLICNSRKGKRKCTIQEGLICSQCCGATRASDKCAGCSYFRDEKSMRNYRNIPYHPLSDMSADWNLQNQANVIESAICSFDQECGSIMDNQTALEIVQRLLDKYHFRDKNPAISNPLVKQGFFAVDKAIEADLSSLMPEEITRLLGAIARSITRHDETRRAYIDFIHEHVGLRVASGVRLMPRKI